MSYYIKNNYYYRGRDKIQKKNIDILKRSKKEKRIIFLIMTIILLAIFTVIIINFFE